jgi:hypothetical protein
MIHKSQFTALILVAGALAMTSVAAAQAAGPKQEPDHHGMTMGDGKMRPMPGMDPGQMRQMVENCNRMMGAALQKTPEAPTPPTVPERNPNG